MRWLIVLLLVIVSGQVCSAEQPEVVLWAWEKREDLLWITPSTTRVAILTATATVTDDKWHISHRRNPVWIPPKTKVIRVVRIDTRHAEERHPDPLLFAQAIYKAVSTLSFTELQIDFDARQSERTWYRAVLRTLRTLLPAYNRLTMTALASWCLGDAWLNDLPVNEIVPMPFRMGRDRQIVLQHLTDHPSFTSVECRSAIGVSIDEPVPIPKVQRLYIFNPQPWREADSSILEQLRRK